MTAKQITWQRQTRRIWDTRSVKLNRLFKVKYFKEHTAAMLIFKRTAWYFLAVVFLGFYCLCSTTLCSITKFDLLIAIFIYEIPNFDVAPALTILFSLEIWRRLLHKYLKNVGKTRHNVYQVAQKLHFAAQNASLSDKVMHWVTLFCLQPNAMYKFSFCSC